MRFLTIFAVGSILILSACSAGNQAAKKNKLRDRNYISSEEIQISAAGDAYHLIKNLRPHWLRGRGFKSLHHQEASLPMVYVNENRHGDIHSLSSISTENIHEIRFYNAGDAAFKFGLNHAGGAILIKI